MVTLMPQPDPESAADGAARPRRRLWPRLLLLAGALLIALLGAEVALRLMTETRGEFQILRGSKLVPFPRFRTELRDVLAELPGSTYVIADAELGWTLKPNGKSRNGLFATNAAGLRSAPRELDLEGAGSAKRTLLVGDSFTHGDEVPWEDTWCQQLEQALGAPHRVWNGGVPGYGTGQAVLRLQRLLPRVRPEVCVLGIFQEDLERNLNVFRPLLHPWTHLPFSKPRFVLDGEGLRLVNQPTLPPQEVEAAIRRMDRHPLREHERYWFPELYSDSVLDGLRGARWLRSLRVHRSNHAARQRLLASGGEAAEVTGRLCRRFTKIVGDAGARPLVVLLPGHKEVPSYRPGRTPVLEPLREVLERLGVAYVDLGPAFLEAAGNDVGSLFVNGRGHPNRLGCSVIARELARIISGT